MSRLLRAASLLISFLVVVGMLPANSVNAIAVSASLTVISRESINEICGEEATFDDLLFYAQNMTSDYTRLSEDERLENSYEIIRALEEYSDALENMYTGRDVYFSDVFDSDFCEKTVRRQKRVSEYSRLMEWDFTNAYSAFIVEEVAQNDNSITINAYEWTFIVYEDKGYQDVCGYGFNHIIEFDYPSFSVMTVRIDNDEFSDEEANNEIPQVTDLNHQALYAASKAAVSFYYNPDQAAAYADMYALNYNSSYANFNSSGGDCANFVSQCLYAGGIPMVDGSQYGSDGWFYYTSTNRSGTWTSASMNRNWFSSYGTLVNNPAASQIHKGNPVYYDWDANGSYDHAAICVGTNDAGTKIVNAHNNDRYHVNWTLGCSSTSTVQLEPITLSVPTLSVNYVGRNGEPTTFSWNAVDHATGYNLRIFDTDLNEEVEFSQWHLSETGCSVRLPQGNYRAVVDAYNDSGYVNSNTVYFTVQEGHYIPWSTRYHDGHIYSLYTEMHTWAEAKELCEKIGGHLVTITSEAENNAVTQLCSNNPADYWIGLTDERTENNWLWVTGEPYSYNYWQPSQPDNWNGLEHYASCVPDMAWNDLPASARRGFICEFDVSDWAPTATAYYGDSKYELYSYRVPWNTARVYAESLGGHLPYIHSAEENSVIHDLLSENIVANCWLGGHDYGREENDFIWNDGSKLTYENWYANEPNNSSAIEHYMGMYCESGCWNDFRHLDSSTNPVFVVEYDNIDISIALNQSSAELEIDGTLQLTAQVNPADLPVDWVSSDEDVATVSDNGLVTAKSAGSTVITVRYGDVSTTCAVTVKENVVLIPLSIPAQFSGASDKTAATIVFTPADGGEAISAAVGYSSDIKGGIFSVELPEGEYSVRVTKPGHTTYTISSFTVGTDSVPQDIIIYAGDINGDGFINAKDNAALTAAFGTKSTDETSSYNSAADFNEDGFINAKDRAMVIANFGNRNVTV